MRHNSFVVSLHDIRDRLNNLIKVLSEDPRVILTDPKYLDQALAHQGIIRNELYLLELLLDKFHLDEPIK